MYGSTAASEYVYPEMPMIQRGTAPAPCGIHEDGYCQYRLPCGICVLTNKNCNKLTNKIRPTWKLATPITVCVDYS